MSGFFSMGEQKIRPGYYKRIENAGQEAASALEGVAAIVVTSNWGPLNKAIPADPATDLASTIGTDRGSEIVQTVFRGGAPEAVVVRVGSGGTKGTLNLQDSAGAGTVVLSIETKYVTDRAFSLSVKPELDDEKMKTATLYEGTRELETRSFMAEKDVTEIDAFVKAFADSAYIKVSKRANGNGTVGTVVQAAFTAGTNPAVTTSDYGAALEAIEAERWDGICVDTDSTEVHATLIAYINRVYRDGSNVYGVIAGTDADTIETRMARAASYNDEKIIYVLNGFESADGTVYQGYLAAALICGMIVACPSNQSLTHTVVQGATGLHEKLTNSQIKRAILSGCFLFSMSKKRQVQIEYSINTLVTLPENKDEGWKKIKRLKIRYELDNRIEASIEPLIGKVDNDTNGQATIISTAQRVVDAMIGEHKLIAGTVSLDASNKPMGDSAWFVVAVDDTDSLEKMYLTFKFRFSQNS